MRAAPPPGFADPVADAQAAFRAVLDALARPATAVPMPVASGGPVELTAAARAVLLALCDEATPVWLDAALATTGVAAWLAFHTGAPVVDDRADAEVAVVSSPGALPPIAGFAEGTDEAPHTGATVLVVDRDGPRGADLIADGPGVERPLTWRPPALPAGFVEARAAARGRFPRGVDLILAAEAEVVGLPRTTRLSTGPVVEEA